MKKTGAILALLAVTMTSGFVYAASLEERKRQASENELLQKETQDLNQRCGLNLSTEIDWSGFKKEDYQSNNSISAFCGAPLSTIGQMCRDNDKMSVDAVKSSIKKITCKRADARNVELKDGTLNYSVDFNSSNDADYVKDFLGKNL